MSDNKLLRWLAEPLSTDENDRLNAAEREDDKKLERMDAVITATIRELESIQVWIAEMRGETESEHDMIDPETCGCWRCSRETP